MTQTLLTQSLKRVSPSVALVVALAVLTGCAVGPNYKRPAVDVPGMYRGSTADMPGPADAGDQALGVAIESASCSWMATLERSSSTSSDSWRR